MDASAVISSFGGSVLNSESALGGAGFGAGGSWIREVKEGDVGSGGSGGVGGTTGAGLGGGELGAPEFAERFAFLALPREVSRGLETGFRAGASGFVRVDRGFLVLALGGDVGLARLVFDSIGGVESAGGVGCVEMDAGGRGRGAVEEGFFRFFVAGVTALGGVLGGAGGRVDLSGGVGSSTRGLGSSFFEAFLDASFLGFI